MAKNKATEADVRRLLDDATGALIAALAHDEAVIHGETTENLVRLRHCWVPVAERIIDECMELDLLGEFPDEEDDYDDDER